MFKPTLPIQLLTTVPGIGLTLAVVIALEIGDVTRFPTAEKLASYAGCTCRVHASGDKLRYGRLRPDVNRYLKWAFIEAANAICLMPGSLESRARQDRRAMSALEQPVGGPAIEVVAKATRRRFTVEYKRKIVREADGCKTLGAVGAWLRREGLYSPHLTTGRAARERGELAGTAKKRGPARRVVDPRDQQLAAPITTAASGCSHPTACTLAWPSRAWPSAPRCSPWPIRRILNDSRRVVRGRPRRPPRSGSIPPSLARWRRPRLLTKLETRLSHPY